MRGRGDGESLMLKGWHIFACNTREALSSKAWVGASSSDCGCLGFWGLKTAGWGVACSRGARKATFLTSV